MAFNYRMTNLQAALGVAQLGRIRAFVRHRRKCAATYTDMLRDREALELPREAPWAKNVYWMYNILARGGSRARTRIVSHLSRRGVDSRVAFWPLHRQPFAPTASWHAGRFPASDRMGRSGLNLPSGNGISEAMVWDVATILRSLD
jgi:perosamine synthetase